MAYLLAALLLLVSSAALPADSIITPAQVAVVVNRAIPASIRVGEYYLAAHAIPKRNLIKIRLKDAGNRISVREFQRLKRLIDKKLPPDIQVMLLVWTKPYAVQCNSITSALTLGFDAAQCKDYCGAGKFNPYFDSTAKLPGKLGLRLTMLLPFESIKDIQAFIDRNVPGKFQTHGASAYFLTTSDRPRDSRSFLFPKSGEVKGKKLKIYNLHANFIEHKKNIMIYETGRIHVPKLDTLTFLPGALADHLTSTGGNLLGTKQMSSLKWLEAGATASYGTVSEPCNYWQKFPDPRVLLRNYLSGETAVEAYWKSVAWPAQGLFIGDPLAAPYCRSCVHGKLKRHRSDQ